MAEVKYSALNLTGKSIIGYGPLKKPCASKLREEDDDNIEFDFGDNNNKSKLSGKALTTNNKKRTFNEFLTRNKTQKTVIDQIQKRKKVGQTIEGLL